MSRPAQVIKRSGSAPSLSAALKLLLPQESENGVVGVTKDKKVNQSVRTIRATPFVQIFQNIFVFMCFEAET
jgi:hypothetical protein